MSNNFKACHKRNSLTYRKGRQRLRPLSMKQLQEKLESTQSGTQRDQISKEIRRKITLRIKWQPTPEPSE